MNAITYDDETMTFHNFGCKHLVCPTAEVGKATHHAQAMSLTGVQNIAEEMFDGDTSLIWFQSCTGIKNPKGHKKPVW